MAHSNKRFDLEMELSTEWDDKKMLEICKNLEKLYTKKELEEIKNIPPEDWDRAQLETVKMNWYLNGTLQRAIDKENSTT